MEDEILNERAFPQPFSWEPEKGQAGQYTSAEYLGYGGMSLRDYFAAKALSGLTACEIIATSIDKQTNGSIELSSKAYALYAYLIADAMLKERKKS